MRLVLCLLSGRSEFLITRGCLPGLCVLYWARALSCGPAAEGGYFGVSEIAQEVGT